MQSSIIAYASHRPHEGAAEDGGALPETPWHTSKQRCAAYADRPAVVQSFVLLKLSQLRHDEGGGEGDVEGHSNANVPPLIDWHCSLSAPIDEPSLKPGQHPLGG